MAVLGDGIANCCAKHVCGPLLTILVEYIDKNDLVLSTEVDEQVLPVASPEINISKTLTFSVVKFDPKKLQKRHNKVSLSVVTVLLAMFISMSVVYKMQYTL